MRVNRWHFLAGIVAIPAAALLAAWIGFFNVGASSGHWKITDWFLHFAMRSAVRTYALAVEPPPPFSEAMPQPAAGHFAQGCALCHGAPGEERSPAVLQMLPQPPDLAQKVGEWTDAELFRIVKHGVRFTGMPAWPSQERDDEVWAMVAFLRRLPELDAAGYRELAFGDGGLAAGDRSFEAALGDCVRCHGRDGMGRSPLTPIIAGQNEAYLVESLRAYAAHERPGGFMSVPAVAADPALWPRLARHFAAQPRPRHPDPPAAAAGRRIAEQGVPQRAVPACLSCHDGRRDPAYPRLDGQHREYLEAQLRLFHAGKRAGTRHAQIMTRAAKGLTEEEIEALAGYFAGR